MPELRSCFTVGARFDACLRFGFRLFKQLEKVVRNRLPNDAVIHLAQTLTDGAVTKATLTAACLRVFSILISGLIHSVALNSVHLPTRYPPGGEMAIFVP
ncbi:hypothetical protein HNE_2342 [Hyphomonas neptunium ATCC 15444]|uniref:Uncharacterized protein n=1 Tax=Hyphomonas neptunium (strain ATCC 15444) TaxID=228405 RepID=Q0BZQ7_HYPNA|nr:hypothetical protein HNE_2342 [Hyphomonas neptunium ATCC 15444]